MPSDNSLPDMNKSDLNKSVQNLNLNTSSDTTANDQSPKIQTPSQSQSHTPTSPVITPNISHSHSQLNSDIQARIMAFQQKRANKAPANSTNSSMNTTTTSGSGSGSGNNHNHNHLIPNLDKDVNKSDSSILGIDKQLSDSNKSLTPIPPLPTHQIRSLSSGDAKSTKSDQILPLNFNSSSHTSSNTTSNPQSGSSSCSNSSVDLNEDQNHHISGQTNQNPSKSDVTSLSQRRGKLKLNISDMNPTEPLDGLSPPVSFPGEALGSSSGATSQPIIPVVKSGTNNPPTASIPASKPLIGSTGELSRRISERKRKPNFKLNLNDDPNLIMTSPKTRMNDPPVNANDNNDNDKSDSRVQSPQQVGSPSSSIDSPGQNQPKLQGLFANYSKYIDIKSGSLNFTGKASLNSTGIDFSSGTSFRISLDQLQFIEELGRGNYGTVSKVLHKPTGVLMAMKEVRLELDESKFTQILMELDVLHKCQSPFIVDFYGAFFVEGAVYMCIEYMDGGSLDKVYEKDVGIKDERHLAYITESVICGLKELKDVHNIIHRDVKPTNILINSKGKVKLCDFGVSGNLVASLAKTNIGCQSYMAPERIKSLNPDDNTYSVQSDIWSLGLTILEIAKGNYPYPAETYDNIFSQLSAMVDGEPPKLDAKLFSKEAQVFVKSCLNKNQDLRPSYQTLLKNPWLVTYRDKPVDTFEQYVKQRISQTQLENKSRKTVPKSKENVSSILKGKVRAPALHRGGLPNNNRSFVNR